MLFRKLTHIAIRHARIIILAWLCFLLAFGLMAVRLPSVLTDHGLRTEGSYAQAQRVLAAQFHIPDEPVILLFEKQPQVSRIDFHHFIEATLTRVQTIGGVDEIVSPLTGAGMEKGDAAYALLSYRDLHRNSLIDRLKQLLPRHPQITVSLTGKPVVQDDVNRMSQSDLKKAELIGIPVAFLILWLTFGGIVSSLIPVLVGLISVTGTMGIMYIIGTKFPLSVFVLNVIPMVGLAISIDFALMIISRFREELRHRPPEQALIAAMQTSGRSVVLSALCVLHGLAGTLFIRMPMFQSIAAGAMIVLVISVLLTLTLVPAVLSLIGRRIQAENIKRSARPDRTSFFWRRLSAAVMKRPVRIFVLASSIVAVCLLPLTHMRIAIPDAGSLPAGYASREAAERFERQFAPANASRVYLIVESQSNALTYGDWTAASRIAQQMGNDPAVIEVHSIFDQFPDQQIAAIAQYPELIAKYAPALSGSLPSNRMLITATISGGASSQKAMAWVRDAEERFAPSTAVPTNPRILVGGESKYQQEVFDEIFNNMNRVLGFIFVSNFMVLFIAFRSVLIPIKTLLMNALSLGASFGILAWIFEEGHFGIEPTDIAVMIPAFIFGLTFGISMDYGMFLLSRIVEVYRRTRDNDLAVREGLALTSGIITSAAAIMIAVTAPFAFGGVSGVKQLGIGIAAAIFIDATLVRMMLVPSLMKLLGKWNWWAP